MTRYNIIFPAAYAVKLNSQRGSKLSRAPVHGGRVRGSPPRTGRKRRHFYTVSGRTVDMAEAYRAVLVPERHRDAVEKYVRDLEELDETQDGERADFRN